VPWYCTRHLRGDKFQGGTGLWDKGPDMTTSVVGRGRYGFIDSHLTLYGAAAAALLVFLYACICEG